MNKLDKAIWEVVKHRCCEARQYVRDGKPLLAQWELGFAQGFVTAAALDETAAMFSYIAKVMDGFDKVWGEVETALDFYHRVKQEGLVIPTLSALDEWREKKAAAQEAETIEDLPGERPPGFERR